MDDDRSPPIRSARRRRRRLRRALGPRVRACRATARCRPGSTPGTSRVHYQSDAQLQHLRDHATQAGDIAALAERALAAETADGYPMPLSDGALDSADDRIDIYVEDFRSFPGVLGDDEMGFRRADDVVRLSSSSRGTCREQAFNAARDRPRAVPRSSSSASGSATRTLRLLAVRGERRVDGLPCRRLSRARPASACSTCRSTAATRSAPASATCTDAYFGNGYSRWPFFEYLSEQYGPSFVKDIFGRASPDRPRRRAHRRLSAALVGQGDDARDDVQRLVAAE